jgi:hypothetical protein
MSNEKEFSFLTPEEQDKIILGCINQHGNRAKKTGVEQDKTRTTSSAKIWTEEAKLVRRQVIIDYIAQGFGHHKIVLTLMDRWGVTRLTARSYVEDAINYMGENIAEFNKNNYDVAVTRLEGILEQSIQSNDRKTALNTIDLLNKIQGLYVNKQEVAITDITTKFKFGE